MRLFQGKTTAAAKRASTKRAAKRPARKTTVRGAKRTTRATARKTVRKKAARRSVRKKPVKRVVKKRAVRKAVRKARPVRKAVRVRKEPVEKAVIKKVLREKKVRRVRPVRRPIKRARKRKVARKRMPLRERVEKQAALPTPPMPKKAPPKIGEIKFKIENIVASANLEVELDLYAIAREVDNVEYEPEQFPGAILKLKDPKTSLLLFKNGKLICTGAKSKDDVERSINKAYGLIQDCIRT